MRDDKLASDAVAELNALEEASDTEAAHIRADGVLTDLLNALGYSDVVEAFEKIGKWYA